MSIPAWATPAAGPPQRWRSPLARRRANYTAPGQLNNVPGQLSGIFRVDGRGEIRLMLVGNVKVAGLTPVEIAEKLTMLYKDEGYLVDLQITVSVAEYRHS